jgi:hypothetical protein
MKEVFSNKKIGHDKLVLIGAASKIMREYIANGYSLTLRQLYYQFISRGIVDPKTGEAMANTVQSYKKLGDAISDGRMLGLLDWDALEDRTRGMEVQLRMRDAAHAVTIIRNAFHIDMWANQPARVEVWIEKEALVGVIEPICRELDVPYLACRGYVSQSEQWRAYRRFSATRAAGQRTIILHFGDHDPSGVDMTRDNRERLEWFLLCDRARTLHADGKKLEDVVVASGDEDSGSLLEVRRLALTMDQIEEYEPPPNPAKATDARFEAYAAEYGDESWELDALDPSVIVDLIQTEVDEIRDADLWAEKEDEQAAGLKKLETIISKLEK